MRILLASILLVVGVAAYADLYQWTDANGQTHFSDKPEPGQKMKVIKTAEPPATSAGVRAPGETDKQIAERQSAALKKLEEARQKKADDQAKADAQAQENAVKCRAARNNDAFMNHGGRMFTYDENGDRRYYSDEEVAEKQAAAQQAVQEACN